MYRALREETPVYWSGLLKQWLVTSYDLVVEVLLNSTVFSNYGYESSYIERLPTEFLIEVDTLRHHWKQEGLMHSGGPKHTRLRRAVGPSFTPKVVSRLEERIQDRVTHLLRNAKARYDHQYEVIQGLAQPLPVTVLADVLGVPERHRDRFPVWSASVLRFFGSPQPDPLNAAELDANLVDWRRLVSDLLRSRSRSPRDDFLTTVARAIDNGQMSAEDGLAICVHLLIAGHETTTNLIGNTIYCLVTRPDQLEEARGSAEALQSAVEETLRYEPPIARIRRVCAESYELGGVLIRKGEPVVAVVAAAHRDAQTFQRPDEFDLHREMPEERASCLWPGTPFLPRGSPRPVWRRWSQYGNSSIGFQRYVSHPRLHRLGESRSTTGVSRACCSRRVEPARAPAHKSALPTVALRQSSPSKRRGLWTEVACQAASDNPPTSEPSRIAPR